MSKPKHTPGPWSPSAWGASARNVIVARDTKGDEIPIAVLLETGLAPEAVEANRRLIVKAPDMAEVCRAALRLLEDEDAGEDDRRTRAEVHDALADVVRAVYGEGGQ